MKPRTWNEFTDGASEWSSQLSRREFLEMAGASLALAGLVGCTRPPRDPVYPYVTRPEDSVPGRPDFFATGLVLHGLATGILVETHEGRPTKIEGNPDHPASRGAASAWQQASVLGLYDPDRAQTVKFQQQNSSWSDFQKAWTRNEPQLSASKDQSFWIVTERSTSPTLLSQIQDLKRKFPQLKWLQYDPLFREHSLTASRDIFGSELVPVYQLKKAQVVVSFDADFLSSAEFPVSYAMDFMQRRRQFDQGHSINQLFVAETTLSLTGLKAQHRLALQSHELANLAIELYQKLPNPQSRSSSSEWINQLIALASKHPGQCAFLAGSHQPPEVHSICHWLNSHYGEKVVSYIPSPWTETQGNISQLQSELEQGKVGALLILGANPVYSSPQGAALAALIQKVPFSARMGLYEDETALACQWFLPQSHSLEAWSDSKSFDGSTLILQPVIEALYQTKNDHELIHFLTLSQDSSSYEILQSQWKKKLGAGFDQQWKRSLQKGLILPPSQKLNVKAKSPRIFHSVPKSSSLEIVFRPSHSIWDGRFANNAWLQELPDPLTKVTWENVVSLSPELAQEQNISSGQILEIEIGGRKIHAPAWILDGLPIKTLVLTLGYGRTHVGSVGNRKGYNASTLMDQDGQDFSSGKIHVTAKFAKLACAQTHQKMEGRDFVKTTKEVSPPAALSSLYPGDPVGLPADEDAWAMVIDLDSCIGCAACVVACQSENNIPVVGKKGVLMGREMHWIRVDRYENGNFQPVPCMHCEKAPCEEVCPVAATVHGNGGLNQMVYNRCVGTRYCSSNCPYKVRRFNFLNFTQFSEVERLQKNPDVTIRTRGVMEKCTYCVQRINHARIQAKLEDRKVHDGEIKTACQQTCPTQAIVFGNLKDPRSQVKKLKESKRNYALLEELGTRPRTTYLAKLSREEELSNA